MKLQHELSVAEEKLRKAHSQGKLLEADRKTLDKGITKANNSIKVILHSLCRCIGVLIEHMYLDQRVLEGFCGLPWKPNPTDLLWIETYCPARRDSKRS